MCDTGQMTRYITIPMEVLQSELSMGAKVLYGLLNSLTAQNGYSWATNEYISEVLNVQVRTIKRWLTELDNLSYIERDRTRAQREIRVVKQGKSDSNGKKRIKEDSDKGQKCPSEGTNMTPPRDKYDPIKGQNCPHLGTNMTLPRDKYDPSLGTNMSPRSYYNNQENNQVNNQANNQANSQTNTPPNVPLKGDEQDRLADDLTTLFDRFWEKYPKKKAKKRALSIFTKLKPSAQLVDTMLQALEEQKRSKQWTEDEGRYIPHPATWLNQARWEDEMETEKLGTAEKDYSGGILEDPAWKEVFGA